MKRATVWFIPEERIGNITLHDHWAADNGVETCGSLNSEQEALDFCWRRWRIPADEVLVKNRPAADEGAGE